MRAAGVAPIAELDRREIVATRESGLPESTAGAAVILTRVYERIRTIFGAYGALPERTRGQAELAHQLVLGLLRQQLAREADIEAALREASATKPPRRPPGSRRRSDKA